MRDVPGEENAAALTATDAVLAIGRQRFPDVLMNTLRRVAAIDHCMVFSFTSEGPARCLLNIGNIGIGADLGEAYSHHFYSSDPNRDTILRHQSEPSPIMLPPFARRMYGDSYRKIFFDDSDINDKYATAIWFENICFYVNFYKVGAGAKFSREQIERMRLIASPISAAIARHYEPIVPRERETLREIFETNKVFECLTGRERDVCASILSGYSSDAISLNLDISIHSTLTYRRRAYEKLGISSQNELFAIVLKLFMDRSASAQHRHESAGA